jgi:PHD/YefM family antitoxin component YafN of YafNO toxin-antitoxin module
MSIHPLLSEPDRIEEPRKAQEYWDMLSRVASTHQPVIICRGGADVAAVIAVEHLALLRDLLAQQEAERLATQVDWARMAQVSPAPPQWFEGEELKPF